MRTNKIKLLVLLTVLCPFVFAESFSLPDGSVFSGSMLHGLFDGKGSVRWENGDYFEGEFHKGKYKGFGKLTTKLYVYEGLFKDGMFNGEGKIIYSNGLVYQGCFVDGLYNGAGNITDSFGNNFVGYFKDNLKNGMGYLMLSTGDSYSGNYENDMFNGKGLYTYANGDRYVGFFKNGLFDGEGELVTATKTYKGIFTKGNLPEKYLHEINFTLIFLIFLLVCSLVLNAVLIMNMTIKRVNTKYKDQ